MNKAARLALILLAGALLVAGCEERRRGSGVYVSGSGGVTAAE
jgi:predicted small secreted protein